MNNIYIFCNGSLGNRLGALIGGLFCSEILNYNPIIATAYSLFIVGTTAGFGTIQNGIVHHFASIQMMLHGNHHRF